MKNTYLVCMLAFLGLGLADLFYLNSRILPALLTEETDRTIAQVVPPEIYSPEKNTETAPPRNKIPSDVSSPDVSSPEVSSSEDSNMGHRITINATSQPSEERAFPKGSIMAENLDQTEKNADNGKQSGFHDSELNSNQKKMVAVSPPVGPVQTIKDKMPTEIEARQRQKPVLIKKIVVHFSNSSYELTSDERHRLVSKLVENLPVEKLRVIIDGHTDKNGAGTFDNELLSRQRADFVADILTKQGIDPKKITVNGFGDTKPLDRAGTPEALAKNRRAEIKLFEDMP